MDWKKALLLFLLFSTVWLSGCWSSRELSTMAITIGTGIDRSPEGYRVTDQILNVKAIAEKTSNEAPTVLYSATGKELLEIKRQMTLDVPRKIYNAHLRVLIFGEEFARAGIGKVLDFFERGHEYRDDFYILVAKDSTAQKVLQVITPLETVSGMKIADSLRTAEKVWAPVKSVRLIELLNLLVSQGQNPVLTGVEIANPQPEEASMEALKESDTPTRLKVDNLGVFKKDKLVGWLDEEASKGYNFIMGNVKSTVGVIQYDPKTQIGIEVVGSKSKIRPELVKGKPAIRVEIAVKANVAAVYGALDVAKLEVSKQIQSKINAKVGQHCKKAVQQAQTEFQSDIFGFGEAMHRYKPKVWKKIKKNWEREFVHLPVKITVKSEIDQLGQVTKPLVGK